MRAIVNTAPGKLEWRELPVPEPGHGQVRIRAMACGICATDLEMIRGWSRTDFPSVPGHEWAGVVDSVGPGCEPSLKGACCVADNILSDGGEVGFEHAGGYAEYFITQAENIRVLPVDFPMHVATLIEPLAVCVRGLNRLRFRQNDSVLIVGDGPIGLLMVILSRFESIRHIVLVGGRSARIALARELGATTVLNYHESGSGIQDELRLLSEAPFHSIIEASGSSSALNVAVNIAPIGGRILVIGEYGQSRAEFLWNHLLEHEIEIIGSNSGTGAWDEAVRLAVEERLPIERLVSNRFPASEYLHAISIAGNDRSNIKTVIEWSDH